MLVRILGAAAGGGLPQWNCRCSNCDAARAGSIPARTQSSVAVSADGRWWVLLNVSPDVRQQILAFPALGPAEGQRRGTGIAGCVLTDAELDHTAGLLLLREGGSFRVHCTPLVRRWLNRALPIEPILSRFANPSWLDLPLQADVELANPDGSSSGLRMQAFEIDRHVPRFVMEKSAEAVGSVIGVRIQDMRTGDKLVYAPCVASINDALTDSVQDAAAVLIDGTFWSDDELPRLGIGTRTATAMGHWPVSGPRGSLAWLAGLRSRHRVYVHINNTNPMLDPRGPEFREVAAHGVRVGTDGDCFEL